MAPVNNDLIALLDRLAPQVAQAFLNAIADIKSEARLSLLIRHLEAGNIEAALATMNLSDEFMAPLDQALRDVYITGGAAALAGLPTLADPLPAGLRWCASKRGTRGPNGGWPSNRRG